MSEVTSPLDDDLKAYFEKRILDNLKAAAFPVVVDRGIESPTPELVFRQLTDRRTDFTEISRAIGEHLFESQATVASSPGLLVVVAGTVDVGPCIALLKLQKQEGVRLERTGARGQETFSVEHLRQLMLTEETRVFKVAVFPAQDLSEVGDVHGIVSDKQRPYVAEKQVADFFLRTFLGCQVRDNPSQSHQHLLSLDREVHQRRGSRAAGADAIPPSSPHRADKPGNDDRSARLRCSPPARGRSPPLPELNVESRVRESSPSSTK
jgi:nucleoid associated protein NdpA